MIAVCVLARSGVGCHPSQDWISRMPNHSLCELFFKSKNTRNKCLVSLNHGYHFVPFLLKFVCNLDSLPRIIPAFPDGVDFAQVGVIPLDVFQVYIVAFSGSNQTLLNPSVIRNLVALDSFSKVVLRDVKVR